MQGVGASAMGGCSCYRHRVGLFFWCQGRGVGCSVVIQLDYVRWLGWGFELRHCRYDEQ